MAFEVKLLMERVRNFNKRALSYIFLNSLRLCLATNRKHGGRGDSAGDKHLLPKYGGWGLGPPELM